LWFNHQIAPRQSARRVTHEWAIILAGVPTKIKVVVHEAEEGGYLAEVPAIPGCATQGETFEELLKNLYEAVEGCLSVDIEKPKSTNKDHVVEIAV